MSYIAAQILFLTSLLGLLGAVNAVRKLDPRRHPLLRPWWFPALLTAELVPARVIIHGAVLSACVAASALDHVAGRLGLWLTAAAWVLYVPIQMRATAARPAIAASLLEMGLEARDTAPVDWRSVTLGWPYRLPSGVERVEDLEFAPGLMLDVYRRGDLGPGPHPTILHVHGGGWRGGDRRQQARPMLHRLAGAGWLCAAMSYPLVPEATFPDQLVAVKRAIVWLRADEEGLGVDRRFVAITGGSAGAHLAALAALTPGRAEYQPGFEDADTSVQAAVTFYGIYDFLNRNQTRDEWPVVANQVMKASKAEHPELFSAASPLDQVSAAAPPFLVVHGDTDSVVPPAEASQFVDALEAVSSQPVGFALVPGANHAFDVLESLRTHYVVDGVMTFLAEMRSVARHDRGASEA
jgi:acetyl esterase/lipase